MNRLPKLLLPTLATSHLKLENLELITQRVMCMHLVCCFWSY